MKRIVSLEISPNSIRAAEILNPLSKNPVLVATEVIEIPPNIAEESIVKDTETFTDAISQLWATKKFGTKKVAVVVGGRGYVVREHTTGHVSMASLRPVLKHDVGPNLLGSTEGLTIDFSPTSHEAIVDGAVSTNGLVFAARTEELNKIVKGLTDAELEVEFIDFAAMAVARFVKNNEKYPERAPYAIVNIREASSDIVIAKQGVPRMIRVGAFGLPVIRKRGRHADEDNTLFIEDEYTEQTPAEKMIREIEQTLSAASNEYNEDIDVLYLSGARSNDRNFIDEVETMLGVHVIPLSIMHANKQSEEFGTDVLAEDVFVAACGGMRGVE